MRVYLQHDLPADLATTLRVRTSEVNGEKFVDTPNPWEVSTASVDVPVQYITRATVEDDIVRGLLTEGMYQYKEAMATVRTHYSGGKEVQKIRLSGRGKDSVGDITLLYGLLRARKLIPTQCWDTLTQEDTIEKRWHLQRAIACWVGVLFCLIGAAAVFCGFYYELRTPLDWIPLLSPFLFAAASFVVWSRIWKWNVSEYSPI